MSLQQEIANLKRRIAELEESRPKLPTRVRAGGGGRGASRTANNFCPVVDTEAQLPDPSTVSENQLYRVRETGGLYKLNQALDAWYPVDIWK